MTIERFLLVLGALAVILLGLVFLVPAYAMPAYGASDPVVRVADFDGTPQYLSLEIFNSGQLSLELYLNGHTLSELNGGKVTWTTSDGRSYQMSNQWDCDDNVCVWEQYVPFDVVSLGIETATPITWYGWGPWAVVQGAGLYKPTPVTQIELSVSLPRYRDWSGYYDPTWDWKLMGSPAWAAEEWFDAFGETVSARIDTSCDGHADNHNGVFFWEEVGVQGHMFGNGVYRPWLRDPWADVQWIISGQGGWSQTGNTKGPICWTDKAYAPFIIR